MIAYLDTSAVVPLLVQEPGSSFCQRIWNDADTVVSCRLTYVEAAAALAQAQRMGRLSERQYSVCRDQLNGLWGQLDIIEVDNALIRRAADLAYDHALRGYDAVHCACAEQIQGPEVVAVSGDRRLLDAWRGLGLSTADTAAGAS